ncbi:hypothetical protein JTB14_032737 [Gonioctena quinquepunctata]|nr:hypothetical protein JTB14_032737 [Gonioctena quinquepunctata]
MKRVGNVRFIGELFKQKMLTVNIMMRCLNFLLDNKDEESLECLCALLTTVGKELESNNVGLSSIFNQMKMLAENKKDTKVSSRIRFKIQDVIDLRRSKWVPKRQDVNPKMLDHIQKEVEREQIDIYMMNSMKPRNDNLSNQWTQNRNGGRSGRNVSDDGWWMTMNTNRNRTTPFTVQSNKPRCKPPTIDEPFGSSSLFGAWGKGIVSSKNKAPGPNTANMYAALENMESDKRSLSQWSPLNQNGMKVYQRDFLLALKESPESKKVPVNIPDVILADEEGVLH